MESNNKKSSVKKKDFLAINIGEKYLKAVHLRFAKSVKKVLNALVLDISDMPDSRISGKLKEFISTQKLKKTEAINVIPSNTIISKDIEIPSVDKKEIREIIDLQAGRHTPYSRDEIIMDYSEIGVFHERYTKILLVIVKRDVVTRRYEIIKRAGFKTYKAALSAEAISVWTSGKVSDISSAKPTGAVHIDSHSTDFTIGFKKKTLYTRSIPIGAQDLSGEKNDKKQEILEELKKSLESYHSENIGDAPSKFFLIGAFADIPKIEAEIKEYIGIDVQSVRDSDIFDIAQDCLTVVEANKGVSLTPLLAACEVVDSLQLNLIPEDVKMRKELKQRAKETTKLGILAMAVLIVFCVVLITKLIFKRSYFGKLKSSYTAENKRAEELKEISERSYIVKSFLKKKGIGLNILDTLINSVPEEVYFNSISFKQDGTTIFTATTDTMSRVFSLVTQLENSKTFKDVRVDFTNTKRVKGKEVAGFGLTLSLEQDIELL